MKVLLCAVGTRGDVQPILALAIELQTQGHDAALCVPPDYVDWVESLGVRCFSIWPTMKITATRAMELSTEQLGQLAADATRFEFHAITEAARGCDLIVAGGPQLATRSVAEILQIPYVFAAYCPAVLPSRDYPPPQLGPHHHPQTLSGDRSALLWEEDQHAWNELFAEVLNAERRKAALAPIDSVQRHIFTSNPWLAADVTLAPAADVLGIQIVQTGPWLLPPSTVLPDYVEEFLTKGDPPVYFGFGSMPGIGDTDRVLIEAARVLGLRSILAQHRGSPQHLRAEPDCLYVGDVAHETLLPRVAAVVHHGGAGTTTAAARAGKGQIVVPHMYDQYYWSHRVQQLGIGVQGPSRKDVDVASIATALRTCMSRKIALNAKNMSSRVEQHGVQIAARLLGQFIRP